MNNIILPSKYEFKEPWHLDIDNFNNLTNTINSIITILEKENLKYYEKEIQKEIENDFLSSSNTIEEKRIMVEERLSNRIFSDEIEKYYIDTIQNKTISDTSLENLIKVHTLEEYEAKNLTINIKKYYINFNLEIDTNRNLLSYSVGSYKIDNEELSAIIQIINHEINNWIEKNKPNIIERVWFEYYSLVAIIVFIFTFIIATTIISETSNIGVKKYQQELKKEALIILENGIQKNEIEKSLEIILKNQIDFVPKDYKYQINYNLENLKVFLWAIFIVFLLKFKPTSIIGLGKNKRKVKIYRLWYRFIIYFIPFSVILPYIINKLSS